MRQGLSHVRDMNSGRDSRAVEKQWLIWPRGHTSRWEEREGTGSEGHVSRRGPWSLELFLGFQDAAGGTVLCRPKASAGGLYSLSTFPEVKVDSVLNLTFQNIYLIESQNIYMNMHLHFRSNHRGPASLPGPLYASVHREPQGILVGAHN